MKSLVDTEAVEAWQSARYDVAVDLLSERGDAESRLLLARILMRQKKYARVEDVLRGGAFSTPDSRVAALILSASAAERLGMDTGPKIVEIPAGASRAARAQVDFFEAQSAFRRGDADRAFASAQKAYASGDTRTRIQALDLQAWIENYRRRLTAAAPLFVEVIRYLEEPANRDEHMRANALQGLSFVAAATLSTSLLPQIEQSLATIEVNEWTARPFLAATISGGLLHGLLGSSLLEFRALLRARSAQPLSKLIGLADVHLATFHRLKGMPDAAKLHLDMAFEDMASIDWPNSDLEQRSVGVSFAAEAASLGDRRAGTMYTRSVSSTGKRDPMLVFEHNEHAGASALLARGRIDEARGDILGALEHIGRAMAICRLAGPIRTDESRIVRKRDLTVSQRAKMADSDSFRQHRLAVPSPHLSHRWDPRR